MHSNPIKIKAEAFRNWSNESSSYYWRPPLQQAKHPQIHLSGSVADDVITVDSFEYSTGGRGEDVVIDFDPENGFQPINKNIEYRQAYNTVITGLNKHVMTP